MTFSIKLHFHAPTVSVGVHATQQQHAVPGAGSFLKGHGGVRFETSPTLERYSHGCGQTSQGKMCGM